MAFVKLFPPEGRPELTVSEIVNRLRDEFRLLETDKDEGQDHVAGMIAAILRFPDDLPGKQEQLDWLRSVQDEAAYVIFGDAPDAMAACCLIPGKELFFGSTEEVQGSARPIVERAAAALNYELFEG